MKVYAAINAVQRELAHTGITKDRKNAQQGYNFRGIDDVFNALSPLLAKHALCILPRCTSRECVERTTQKGGALFYVTVAAEFDFVSAEDGSKHTVCTFGEAMDSADKATNKAMSAAYKYAAFQAFAIPTEGDNDADGHTYEVAPSEQQAAKGEGFAAAIRDADSESALTSIGKQLAGAGLPPAILKGLRALYSERHKALKEPPPPERGPGPIVAAIEADIEARQRRTA